MVQVARRSGTPTPTDHNRNCFPKQSLPHIRAVQHTVLFVLGLKGTMAQAELHFIRARLLGGKLNKAQKGELRFPLPVGFCHDEDGRIVPDPDEEVRGAVSLVFRLFHETGSAFAVVQNFAKRALPFPKRAYGGAWNGKLVWGRLTHTRVLCMLKNPSYAGVYVFGRYQYHQTISTTGEIQKKMHAVAMPDWRVQLRQHHDGYITWEEFLCGNCGHAISVRYTGNGGIYPMYQCNRQHREGLATKDCMSFRCDLLDAAVSEEVLKALQPAELQLALAALQELEARDQGILRQWQMRLERAEYEVALAERRYQEVDPSNRLVANTLERRWNETLLYLQDLKKQAAEFQRQEAIRAQVDQSNEWQISSDSANPPLRR